MSRIRLPRHKLAAPFWARARYIPLLPLQAGNDLGGGVCAYASWRFGRNQTVVIEVDPGTVRVLGMAADGGHGHGADISIPTDIDPRDVGAVARFLTIVADHDPRFADAPGLVIAGIRNIAAALSE